MPRAAVLGRPVAHSLSPVLHGAAYAALGLHDWTYERVECAEQGLAGFVAGLDADWVGLSLTMPLKRVGLDLADEATGLATAVGAANTLLLSVTADGKRHCTADNTDVAGIVDALAAVGCRSATTAAVLGAGGTAQAALAALRQLGVAEPTVVVRDPGRAGEVLRTAERLGVRVHLLHWPTGPGPAADALVDVDVLVSTVPRGAADGLATLGFDAGQTVLDVVYDPWPTPLASGAAARGARVVPGLAMLVHQAAHQVRLMTGRAVDPSVLAAAVG